MFSNTNRQQRYYFFLIYANIFLLFLKNEVEDPLVDDRPTLSSAVAMLHDL